MILKAGGTVVGGGAVVVTAGHSVQLSGEGHSAQRHACKGNHSGMAPDVHAGSRGSLASMGNRQSA